MVLAVMIIDYYCSSYDVDVDVDVDVDCNIQSRVASIYSSLLVVYVIPIQSICLMLQLTQVFPWSAILEKVGLE